MTIGHRLFGAGPDGVIVLHGWFSDHTVFNPMMTALDTERFTYAFIDQRGYGLSRQIPGNYTIAEVAGDAVELADSLGWRKFSLVGHSMGGSVAQRICVDAPERIASCIGVTPVPASGVPMEADGLALFEGAATSDANRRAIVDFSTGCRLPGPWLDYVVALSRRVSTVEAFEAYFHAWCKTDFVAEAKGLRTPMLVIGGANDQGLNPDVLKATFLDWYPNASLTVIDNAGHYPMQEAPIHLAGLINAFLAAPDAPSKARAANAA